MFLSPYLLRQVFVFFAMLFSCALTHAVAAVDAGKLQLSEVSSAELGLRFVRDPAQTLTLDDVRKLPDHAFSTLQRPDVNQRFQRGQYWLRTSVHNSSAGSITWVLRHPMPITDHVDYWVFANGQLLTHATGGDRTVMAERQIPYRLASVRHTMQAGERAEIYIRMRNKEVSPMHLTFTLSDEATFMRTGARDQLSMGVLYGIPMALVIYALAGWLIEGSRSSLIYVGYVLSVMGSWLGLNGQLEEFVFIGRPDLANTMLLVFFLLVTIWNCMFAREFLQTKRSMPRFDWYFRGVIALAMGGIALRLVGVHVPVVQVTVALVFAHAVAPLAAIVAQGAHAAYARWYLMAQLVYNAAVIIGIIGARFGDLKYENYFFYCQLAFIAEILLLGVAQQNRVRMLRREKSLFEQKYNTSLQMVNAELARQLEQRNGQLREAQLRAEFMATVKTATGRIAKGEFDVRLDAATSAELSELASNVNVMAASLARLEGARKRWIADISHELRLPLFSLLCETEALLDGVRSISREAMASIHEEVMRLSRLVADLHEVALTDLRPLPCTFINWELAHFLRKKEQGYIRAADQKGLRFSLELHVDKLVVKWDQGRLEQLLDNLVQNSISYTDAPGAVVLIVKSVQNRVLITLQDTLPGIAPVDAQHLFEPLYRTDTARSRRAGGSGLGLAICQAIVQAHCGTIAAAPSPLGGLAIHVALPMAIDK